MGKFREWLREAECKKNVNEETVKEETEYQKFFAKKLEKFGVSSPAELSVEDKKKFFDEIDAEWEGEKEEPEDGDVNEANWDDAKNAVYDLADMFKRGKSKITSDNSINIEVRGIVGKVVFDPSFKL